MGMAFFASQLPPGGVLIGFGCLGWHVQDYVDSGHASFHLLLALLDLDEGYPAQPLQSAQFGLGFG